MSDVPKSTQGMLIKSSDENFILRLIDWLNKAECEPDSTTIILADKLIIAAQELAGALRELHDFAIPDTHYRHEERSRKAFGRASELLKRVGY